MLFGCCLHMRALDFIYKFNVFFNGLTRNLYSRFDLFIFSTSIGFNSFNYEK